MLDTRATARKFGSMIACVVGQTALILWQMFD